MQMQPFDQAISSLPGELQQLLSRVDPAVRQIINEIRLRVGRPLILIDQHGHPHFISENGQTFRTLQIDSFCMPRPLLDECVRSMSDYSLHSVQNSLQNGFLTLRGGHRAGFSGNVAWEEGRVTAVRRVDSINIRIARSIVGAADRITGFYRANEFAGTLIIGPPASGKTTILKDLCRQLSNGDIGEYYKVSLIDERGEIAASYRGEPQNDVGWNTDVFDGYSKPIGFDIAVRCMSPDVIVCDEIGVNGDPESLLQGVNSGSAVVATIHSSSLDEFLHKKNSKELLASGAFRYFVFLGSAKQAGTVREIIRYDEICRDVSIIHHIGAGGTDVFGSSEKTGQGTGTLSGIH